MLLAIAAMRSADPATWRLAWTALELIGWYAIVPIACAALITGIVMAVGTQWGLVRHYWVLGSLVLTTIAVAVLVRHMFDVSEFARMALASEVGIDAQLRIGFRGEVLHAGLGLLILLVIEGLNVYKPRGETPFVREGSRELAPHRVGNRNAAVSFVRRPLWLRVVVGHVIAIGVLAGVFHAIGGGFRH